MQALVILALMVLVRASITGGVGSPALLMYSAIACALCALAVRFPIPGAVLGLVVLAAVPIYWGRAIPALYISSAPGHVVPLLLVIPAYVVAKGRVRMGALDAAVLGLAGLLIVSYVLNFDGPLAAGFVLMVQMVVPYLVGRFMATDDRFLALGSVALVAVVVPLSIIGLREAAGVGNPFFTLVTPGFEGEAWAHGLLRFERMRAEASFGHPIAFGMFLAFALVIAVALLWSARPGRRLAYGAALTIGAFGLLATLSRGPIAVFAIGVVVWLLAQRRDVKPHHLLMVGAALVMLVTVTPAGNVVRDLSGSLTGTSSEAATAEHRLTVNSLITDARYFSFFGIRAEGYRSPSEAARAATGLHTLNDTIDSEYALLYVSHGLTPFVAFLLLGLAVWTTVPRRGMSGLERAWCTATAAAFVGLFSVTLLTQHRTLFWIAIGVVATTRARHRPATAGQAISDDGVVALKGSVR